MLQLDKLLYLQGIASEFYNYASHRVEIPWNIRLDALRDSGCQLDSQEQIDAQVYELDALSWTSWLRPQQICTSEKGDACHMEIRLHPSELECEMHWQCNTETGDQLNGVFIPRDLEQIGDYYIDGVGYSARKLILPSMPYGYHRFSLIGESRQQICELIIAPPRCYQPVANKSGRKFFGVSCQLYTLKSDKNWGIGDFSDLLELVEHCAKQDMDLIGLNPLHAPEFQTDDFSSPYSPSDRRFLNPLYIDPTKTREYKLIEADLYAKNPGIAKTLNELRSSELVDYKEVARIKFTVFEEMYQAFQQKKKDRQYQQYQSAFDEFIQEQSKPLLDYASHQANNYMEESLVRKDWLFYAYLQFIASEQLDECQRLAKELGMCIGLKGDLAVGSVANGAEVQTNRSLYAYSAKVGAPPDQFSTTGQNWDLPALNPVQLRKSGFRHFIDLLRNNMRHFGAIRIDHVMALMRLWWCLPENKGLYVYYPLEEMLALLKLESVRNQCVVIGEDMGVVPPLMRQKMSESGMYGNRLLYFDRHQDQRFLKPEEHLSETLFMVTNHDVPTLAGWWAGLDISLRLEFNTLDIDEAKHLRTERQSDKYRLLEMMTKTHDQETNIGKETTEDWKALISASLSESLCHKILLSCAESQADFLLIQLEDLSLIEKPVNIPGTYREYPNWRRKQKESLDNLFSDPKIQGLLNQMLANRPIKHKLTSENA